MNDAKRAFILSLDRDGELTPDEVLAAAEPEDSPIHDEFEWDDSRAGHSHRLAQARSLITRVRVRYLAAEPVVTEIRVAEYIHDPAIESRKQGYVRSALLRSPGERERALLAIKAELARVESMVTRGRNLAAHMGLAAEFEDGLKTILITRKKAKVKAG